jgi:S1-C subfamily serine protease
MKLAYAMVVAAGMMAAPAFGGAALGSAAVAAAEPDFEAMAAAHAPAIVTIKFVMKMELPGMGDREEETETFGVMIDPKGLVLVSNTQMGGFMTMMARRRGMEISVKPSKIKVLVGDDTVGVDATLIARDSELDLAWVKVTEPAGGGAKPFEVLDFTASGEAKLGQKLYLVAREGRFFDRVPSVTEFRVAALAKKPRALILPGGQSLGMPVFDGSGKVVGVTVLQLAADEESDGGMSGRSGGAAILPASEVVSATKRALETAAAGGGEEAAEEKAKAAEPEPAKSGG